MDSIEKSSENRLNNVSIPTETKDMITDIKTSTESEKIYYKTSNDKYYELCSFKEIINKPISDIIGDKVITNTLIDDLREFKLRLTSVEDNGFYDVSVRKEKDGVYQLYIDLDTEISSDFKLKRIDINKNYDSFLNKLNENYFDDNLEYNYYKLETIDLYVDGLNKNCCFYTKEYYDSFLDKYNDELNKYDSLSDSIGYTLLNLYSVFLAIFVGNISLSGIYFLASLPLIGSLFYIPIIFLLFFVFIICLLSGFLYSSKFLISIDRILYNFIKTYNNDKYYKYRKQF